VPRAAVLALVLLAACPGQSPLPGPVNAWEQQRMLRHLEASDVLDGYSSPWRDRRARYHRYGLVLAQGEGDGHTCLWYDVSNDDLWPCDYYVRRFECEADALKAARLPLYRDLPADWDQSRREDEQFTRRHTNPQDCRVFLNGNFVLVASPKATKLIRAFRAFR
jgi:hypothetical protein